MNIHYILHLLVPIYITILPFLPVRILRYLFFTPVLLPIIWLIFDGCPISKADADIVKNYKGSFVYSINKRIFPNITLKGSNNLMKLIIMSSMAISAFKVQYYYGVYSK